MVKSYWKFEHSKSFGQICSATSNVVWNPASQSQAPAGKPGSGLGIVGANEEVLIWDIKSGEIIARWKANNNTARVTIINQSQTDPDIFAVGYEDGRIRIWDFRTATVVISFNGHKSAITALQFDHSGVRLASGAKDTDLIVWDLVGEVGLYKLRGHKDQITSLNFLSSPGPDGEEIGDIDTDQFLLSTSKDSLIKIWNLSVQHCIETHVAQSNGECWTLGVSPDQSGCITAGNDGELRTWAIDQTALSKVNADSVARVQILHDRGSFYRNGKDRTLAIQFHPKKDLVAIHGSEKAIEVLRIRSEDEIRKSQNRKRKRKREKLGIDTQEPINEAETGSKDAAILVTEVFVPYVIIRTGGKVRSLDWAGAKSARSVSILVSTSNNQLELYELNVEEKKVQESPDYVRSLSVDMPGHRSDVRCLALSSDDRMLASASQGSLKIWNTKTQNCLRTLDCGHALCATFLPGDRVVVVGTREGSLEVFDITSSSLLDIVQAHERDIWSIHVHPDGKSIVTGSADKSAKFWDLKVVQEEVLGTNRKAPKLTLVHSRTLKLSDDILSLRFTPDGKLLAVSTLDTTVKVFYTDTLKLYLTLYGHKLPVLSLDISYDSKLIVTSSADKNVRIWGLDFGDCHKAFFAHNDSILTVSFVPENKDGNGHHFFSASKDRVVKYYDGDKFEQIQKLEGHHGEIWAMAVAHSGDFIVTASHDKSIRIWQQTDEQIFLEEEREKELDELYENTLLSSLEEGQRHEEGDETSGAVEGASKQTAQTLMAGEKIAEALDLGVEDLELMREYESLRQKNPKAGYPQRNPVFLANNNVSASLYVLSVIQKIPSASLQDALLVLSFSQLPSLFVFLALWAEEGRNIPLTCRLLFFMLKTHQKQLVTSQAIKPLLDTVRHNLRITLQQQKNDIGFNLAGLRVLGRRIADLGESSYVGELTFDDGGDSAVQGTQKGKKRAFVNVA